MYIKLFQSRDSNCSYTIIFPYTINTYKDAYDYMTPYIENEKHETLPVAENELFDVIDRFFKEKLKGIK
jgi:hypothetical protein